MHPFSPLTVDDNFHDDDNDNQILVMGIDFKALKFVCLYEVNSSYCGYGTDRPNSNLSLP